MCSIITIFESNSHFGGSMKYQTGKREQVIELLKNNSEKSLSLAQICEKLLSDGHGRSTVYRLVSSLVECGMLRRLGDGKTRHVTYQYVGDEHCKHHLHLKCKECGRLIHLDEGVSEGIKDTLVRIGGFSIDEGEMLLGKCTECRSGDKDGTCDKRVTEIVATEVLRQTGEGAGCCHCGEIKEGNVTVPSGTVQEEKYE